TDGCQERRKDAQNALGLQSFCKDNDYDRHQQDDPIFKDRQSRGRTALPSQRTESRQTLVADLKRLPSWCSKSDDLLPSAKRTDSNQPFAHLMPTIFPGTQHIGCSRARRSNVGSDVSRIESLSSLRASRQHRQSLVLDPKYRTHTFRTAFGYQPKRHAWPR